MIYIKMHYNGNAILFLLPFVRPYSVNMINKHIKTFVTGLYMLCVNLLGFE